MSIIFRRESVIVVLLEYRGINGDAIVASAGEGGNVRADERSGTRCHDLGHSAG